jgi:hypothetical protein
VYSFCAVGQTQAREPQAQLTLENLPPNPPHCGLFLAGFHWFDHYRHLNKSYTALLRESERRVAEEVTWYADSAI